MQDIETIEQYLGLINEALLEVDEMRHAIEYDEDYMTDSAQYVDQIEQHLLKLKQELEASTHQFGGEDLPFMALIKRAPEAVIPFKYLLKTINKVHLEAQL